MWSLRKCQKSSVINGHKNEWIPKVFLSTWWRVLLKIQVEKSGHFYWFPMQARHRIEARNLSIHSYSVVYSPAWHTRCRVARTRRPPRWPSRSWWWCRHRWGRTGGRSSWASGRGSRAAAWTGTPACPAGQPGCRIFQSLAACSVSASLCSCPWILFGEFQTLFN